MEEEKKSNTWKEPKRRAPSILESMKQFLSPKQRSFRNPPAAKALGSPPTKDAKPASPPQSPPQSPSAKKETKDAPEKARASTTPITTDPGLYNNQPAPAQKVEKDTDDNFYVIDNKQANRAEPDLYNNQPVPSQKTKVAEQEFEKKVIEPEKNSDFAPSGYSDYNGGTLYENTQDNLYVSMYNNPKSPTSYSADEMANSVSKSSSKSEVPPDPVKQKFGVRNWNEEYQTALDRRISGGKAQDWYEVASIGKKFSDTATIYAKIIISEQCMKDEEKTIKPINIGGVAGGLKFRHNGILFKFATDTMVAPNLWMYGGPQRDDVAALKASKNEMLSLGSHDSAHIVGLSYPLTTVVDYKGYRLVAMCDLPIDKSTILYGSSDGGRTVHCDDELLNKLMGSAGWSINLAGHITGRGSAGKEIFGPGDLEGHKGYDGRYYVLDFGRLMPPEAPGYRGVKEGTGREIFFQLLRPEFVKFYKVPLCSDAFSAWNSDPDKDKRDAYDQSVIEATEFLYSNVIPSWADILDQRIGTGEWKALQHKIAKDGLARELLADLHAKGINFRHLGHVRCHTKSTNARRFLLSIAISRIVKDDIKKLMKSKMFEVSLPSDEPFKAAVAQLLSNFRCEQQTCTKFWGTMKFRLAEKYGKMLSEDEITSSELLDIDFAMIFSQVLLLCGIKLSKSAKARFLHSESTRTDSSSNKVLEEDIKAIVPLCYHTTSTAYSMGHYQLMSMKFDIEHGSVNLGDRHEHDIFDRKLKTAIGCFQVVNGMAPLCPLNWYAWGEALRMKARLSSQVPEADSAYDKAVDRYERSYDILKSGEMAKEIAATLRQWGDCLQNTNSDRRDELYKIADEKERVGGNDDVWKHCPNMSVMQGIRANLACVDNP